jgi:hypothetical protein
MPSKLLDAVENNNITVSDPRSLTKEAPFFNFFLTQDPRALMSKNIPEIP